MSFESMLKQAEGNSVVMEPGWAQGRATFGGVLGALVLAHLQPRVASDAKLRAMTVSFVAPVELGEISIQSEILRSGKSVTQMQCHLLQAGKVVLSALASFGVARPSSIVVESAAAPSVGALKDAISLPYIEGMMPEFTRLINFKAIGCDMPFSGSDKSHIDGWMRWSSHAEVSENCSKLFSLVALIDAWPPAILQMMRGPHPASSLTWTMEFPCIDDAELSGETNPWWQYHAETEAAQNGYGHIAAQVWNENGKLVAISRQAVTVFA